MSIYKITVNGELLDGEELEQVKQRFSKLFDLDSEPVKLEKFFSGKTITIKKGLSKEQADKYYQIIRKAGLACEVSINEVAQPPKEMSQKNNLNQQSGADIVEGKKADDFVLVDPKKLPVSAGWDWIKEGFKYFTMSPVLWVGTILLLGVIFIVISLIPIVSIISGVTGAVFGGSFMLICYKQYRGETFGIGDLFSGFKNHFGRLMAVGALYFLGMLIITALIAGTVFAIVGGLNGMVTMERNVVSVVSVVSFLVSTLLLISLAMTFLFAPALVVLHDVPAIQAMKLSFKGCLRNIWPFTLYALICMGLGILAVLPMMLGLLILFPVISAAIFAAYRQIYTNSEAPETQC